MFVTSVRLLSMIMTGAADVSKAVYITCFARKWNKLQTSHFHRKKKTTSNNNNSIYHKNNILPVLFKAVVSNDLNIWNGVR